MRGGVLVDAVFLFIGHAVATGNLSGGTGLVAGTGQRSVTEGFRPVAPSVGVPLVDDHFHRHGTAPDTAINIWNRRSLPPGTDARARDRRATEEALQAMAPLRPALLHAGSVSVC